ncbi:MAG: FMN-binding negative transcriptional regulator [Magnetovibrio sp.]|nr:FMN-binding negative transcriptional regulator [Magnetovibrio sp.]
MFQPSQFAEHRIEVMHDLIRNHALATLISSGQNGLTANHLPLVLHPGDGKHGLLRGHIAKVNPIWKDFDASVERLVIFQGPQHYVSPSWYPSKQEQDKAVPTWNYAVVHAHASLTVTDDADWLLKHVQTLTAQHEAGRKKPWAVDDAPQDYIDQLIKGIIGLELHITRLYGTWKVSQNRSEQDRNGIVQGLIDEDTTVATQMANLVSAS